MLSEHAAAQIARWREDWAKMGKAANYASIGAGLPVPTEVDPRIRDLMIEQDHTGFFKKINVIFGLIETKGNAVGMDIAGPIVKRTPYGTDRAPAGASTEEIGTYELLESEFDPEVYYSVLTAWARDPQFRVKIAGMVQRRIALDLLNIGFNGTADGANVPWAADGSQVASMHKGWLQRCRAENVGRSFTEIVPGSGKVFYGAVKVQALNNGGAAVNVGGGVVGLPSTAHGFLSGANVIVTDTVNYNAAHLVLPSSTANQINITAAFVAENMGAASKATQNPDFASLDELVTTLLSFIPIYERQGLTAFLSDAMYSGEKGDLYSIVGATPTERLAVPQVMSNLGGLPVETPAYFPNNKLMITRHNNLSYYRHAESWRNMVLKDERKALVFWNLVKDDFVVENYRAIALMENIYKI